MGVDVCVFQESERETEEERDKREKRKEEKSGKMKGNREMDWEIGKIEENKRKKDIWFKCRGIRN